MENNNMTCNSCMGGCGGCGSCGSTCGGGCDSYGWRCGSRHYAIRWLIGLGILALTFGIGVKFGEIKSYVHSDYRFEKMMGGNGEFIRYMPGSGTTVTQ